MFSQFKPKNHWRAIGFLAVTLVVSLAATTVPGLAKDEVKLTFRAFAVNMSNIATGANAPVEIHISRWSTEAEHDELLKTLEEQGDKKLVDALQKQKETGWTRAEGAGAAMMRQGFPSTRLRYSRNVEQGNKRDIVLITDRPIGFREAARDDRTMDYPISIIVLALEKDDKGKWKGKGKMAVGVKLKFNKEKNKFEVENYSTEPVRLNDVKEQ
jgi:hypothetical protein